MIKINEEIFKQLVAVYNLKTDNKFVPEDLTKIEEEKPDGKSEVNKPPEIQQDNYYSLLKEMGKFLTQAQAAIAAGADSPELLSQELAVAEKALLQPGVHAHEKADGLAYSKTITRRAVTRALFKDAPDKVNLIDYLPMWLRSLPFFTDRKNN